MRRRFPRKLSVRVIVYFAAFGLIFTPFLLRRIKRREVESHVVIEDLHESKTLLSVAVREDLITLARIDDQGFELPYIDQHITVELCDVVVTTGLDKIIDSDVELGVITLIEEQEGPYLRVKGEKISSDCARPHR
ncbi:hypothetical protein MMH89_02740 [Candidatus Comchoanobacter bicostacola]|uniref:Uncharacterized protein n=1 Tax=Candidatus Comchoanobacter bicostacola TaxID=2919598 RepID=A0ABY5DI32_9GAMM|nr:hypothetical protein [Candidatus Comchoanobacter bicostacola]UTC24141.1 hypothetical protein MMH89_02740 [Candidatus Comchoanobacter bicostacola]